MDAERDDPAVGAACPACGAMLTLGGEGTCPACGAAVSPPVAADTAAGEALRPDARHCDWCGATNEPDAERCVACQAMFPRPEQDEALRRASEERMRAVMAELELQERKRKRRGVRWL